MRNHPCSGHLRLGLLLALGSALFSIQAQDPSGGSCEFSRAINTSDSPLKIEKRWGKCQFGGDIVTRVPLNDDNRVGFVLQNASDRSVRAYALVLVNGTEKGVRMALY